MGSSSPNPQNMLRSILKTIDLPPVWLVAAMALAWSIGWVLPNVTLDSKVIDVAGYALMGVGVGLMIWCAVLFQRAKTPIIPRNRPDAMVTDGPYRFSRNPIYLADAVILFGWILVVGSPVALVLLPAFVLVINKRFITGEEAVLRQEFGDAYSAWSLKVRRWI